MNPLFPTAYCFTRRVPGRSNRLFPGGFDTLRHTRSESIEETLLSVYESTKTVTNYNDEKNGRPAESVRENVISSIVCRLNQSITPGISVCWQSCLYRFSNVPLQIWFALYTYYKANPNSLSQTLCRKLQLLPSIGSCEPHTVVPD